MPATIALGIVDWGGERMRLLARCGFAAWFGAGLWFGAFGAQALFRALGAQIGVALAALFPSIFAFGVVAGVAAGIGSLADVSGQRRRLRFGMAGLMTATALADLLVIDGWVAAAPVGSPAFAAAHLVSVLVALCGWCAASVGLLLG